MINLKIRKDFFKVLKLVSSILIGSIFVSFLKSVSYFITPVIFIVSALVFLIACFAVLFLVVNKIKTKSTNKKLKKHYSKIQIKFFDNILHNLTSIAQIFIFNKILKRVLLGFANLFMIFLSCVCLIFLSVYLYLSTFDKSCENYSSIQNSKMEIASFLYKMLVDITFDLIFLFILNSSLIPLAIANINFLLAVAFVYVVIVAFLVVFECYDDLDLGRSLRNVSVELEICFTIRDSVNCGLRKINNILLGVITVVICALCLNNFFITFAFFSILSVFVLYNVFYYLSDAFIPVGSLFHQNKAVVSNDFNPIKEKTLVDDLQNCDDLDDHFENGVEYGFDLQNQF